TFCRQHTFTGGFNFASQLFAPLAFIGHAWSGIFTRRLRHTVLLLPGRVADQRLIQLFVKTTTKVLALFPAAYHHIDVSGGNNLHSFASALAGQDDCIRSHFLTNQVQGTTHIRRNKTFDCHFFLPAFGAMPSFSEMSSVTATVIPSPIAPYFVRSEPTVASM